MIKATGQRNFRDIINIFLGYLIFLEFRFISSLIASKSAFFDIIITSKKPTVRSRKLQTKLSTADIRKIPPLPRKNKPNNKQTPDIAIDDLSSAILYFSHRQTVTLLRYENIESRLKRERLK